MKVKLILIPRVTLFILLSFLLDVLLTGCSDSNDPNSSPNTVTWEGAWENGEELFGTFTLNMTFEGENMLYYGGEGTISGSVTWTRWDGQDLVSSELTGEWENNQSVVSDVPSDRLDYSVSSIDGSLEISDYIMYEFAAEIDNNIFTLGSSTFNSISGSWYTKIDSDSTDIPNVSSAVQVVDEGEFLDAAYIDGKIYATVFDDPDYKIVSINIKNGTAIDVTGLTCSEPMSIACDGTNTWVVGKASSGDTDYSLFKYEGVDFSTDVADYPVVHADLDWADSISWSGSVLYFHNGSVLQPKIGSINMSTAEVEVLLNIGWDTLPGTVRTNRIAAAPNVFYITYFSAGGEWCRINKINTSGALISSLYCPVNITGPMAINENKLYIIEAEPGQPDDSKRLYVIQL